MNRLVYQYSIVRFVPFPETEEFANIGIVVSFPQLKLMTYKLESLKKTKRVVDFFDLSQKKQLYKAAIESLAAELSFMGDRVREGVFAPEDVISSLARPKQTLLQYSTVRAGFTLKNPEELLGDLFSTYVEFDSHVKELNEQRLERTIKSYLDNLNLDAPFKKREIGSKDRFRVTFPFVRNGGGGLEVIKPLYIGQKDATKVFEHGDLLLSKLRRLQSLKLLPKEFLVVYQLGSETADSAILESQQQLLKDLEGFGDVVPGTDQESIQKFATSWH